jgi:peptidoglycan/LPS O-acetylase OafA/YrhL
MNRWITVAVRWAARISGLALVGLVLLFWIGEGGPANILTQPLPVMLEFAGTLLMLGGFLIGWRWPALGGCTALAGFCLFLGTEFAVNGKPPGGVIPLFLIPGVLLLISAGLEGYQRRTGKGDDLRTA